MASKRLFLAIDPGISVNTLLHEVIMPLVGTQGLRIVPERNLHITVAFLGNILLEDIEDIISGTDNICAKTPSFELHFEKISVIRKGSGNEMIWAQFSKNQVFHNLVKTLRKIFNIKEEREPIAHITLAKMKKSRLKDVNNLALPVPEFLIPVKEIGLWESILESGTPEYRLLSKFPFGNT